MSRVDGLRWDSWPSKEDLDLLTALVHIDPAVARAAWKRFRRTWDPDMQTGEQFRLTSLLVERLELLDPSDPYLGRAQGVRRNLTVRALLLQDELDRLLSVLEAVGIVPVVLKGPALALSVYDHVGQRISGDLDVLVQPADFGRARSAIEADGWVATMVDGPGCHSVSFRRGELEVDLHRHLNREMMIPGLLSDTLSLVRVVEAPRRLRSGRAVRILAPTDALVHTFVHGSQQFLPINSRWLVDAVRLMTREEIDWEHLVRLARRFRVASVVHDCLVLVGRVSGLAVPASVISGLESVRSTPFGRIRTAAFHVQSSYSYRAHGFPVGLATFVIDHQHLDALGMVRVAPSALARQWGLDSPWQVPGAVFGRALRRLRWRA